jgi:murein tripeptide amidase MpaA
MRLYDISETDVAVTIAEPGASEQDERGNLRLSGQTADGRPILVVVAADDPQFVITTFLQS